METLSEGRGGDLIEVRWKYFRLIIRAKEIAKVKKKLYRYERERKEI